VEQRIVIKFLVGENVPSAEIHHRPQQQYGEECLLRRLDDLYTFTSVKTVSTLRSFFKIVSAEIRLQLRTILDTRVSLIPNSFPLSSLLSFTYWAFIFSRVLLSLSCLSVLLSAWNNSAPTGRIFMKFDTWEFFLNSAQKIQISWKSEKNNGWFTWRPIYILIISR